jgi:acetoin utilization deacetylase AcuC-like enzyme
VTTGLAYSKTFLDHAVPAGHPERPARVSAIVEHLQVSGLWHSLDVWEPAPASDATLELVHTPDHVAYIRELTQKGGGRIDLDTGASAGSWEPAVRAVGAVLEAVERVLHGTLTNAYCVVRPPGHHATPGQAMGFCLFNNVAIAARWLLDQGLAERVAILDYDVHHGNGTQDVFFNDPRVLYLSTHQYPFYPGTGHWREVGHGTTVNVPLPQGAGDLVYADVVSRLVEPVFRRFRPSFVLVSLGFDAFWRDPLANLRLTLNGYETLLRSAFRLALELCGGRLVVALEGGYDLQALAHGSELVCRLLLGEEPPPDPLGGPPEQLPPDAFVPLLERMRELHQIV